MFHLYISLKGFKLTAINLAYLPQYLTEIRTGHGPITSLDRCLFTNRLARNYTCKLRVFTC
jgi:hypothetical protein